MNYLSAVEVNRCHNYEKYQMSPAITTKENIVDKTTHFRVLLLFFASMRRRRLDLAVGGSWAFVCVACGKVRP